MTTDNIPEASIQEAWSLERWLEYLAEVHPSEIELGLDRTAEVFSRLKIDFSKKNVVTVAGTNGKGTTCAMIEQAILMTAKSVAVYSSPHLIDYRERLRINGLMLTEQQHCAAFLAVENARGNTLLTYFEFATLAAFVLMRDSSVDILLLEVGLGGRLDAVNVVDPNIAVITTIDLDHQSWLGDNREDIGREKAGIFRPNIPVVIGDLSPPESIFAAAKLCNVKASWQGKDFTFREDEQGFHWRNQQRELLNLPLANIPAQNASTALQVIDHLTLPLSEEDFADLLAKTSLPGRRQIIQHSPTTMLDVAHNPQATRELLREIQKLQYARLYLVVSMLSDKDIEQTLEPFQKLNANWLIAPLDVQRGATTQQIISVLDKGQKVLEFDQVKEAYQYALESAVKDDLIIVFGSFFTVAEVLKLIQKR
jgi:dihydrofolate synthase/folylpolyglutamate synthase